MVRVIYSDKRFYECRLYGIFICAVNLAKQRVTDSYLVYGRAYATVLRPSVVVCDVMYSG